MSTENNTLRGTIILHSETGYHAIVFQTLKKKIKPMLTVMRTMHSMYDLSTEWSPEIAWSWPASS